eukprot:283171_1
MAIGNVVVSVNLMPRICAVITGNEEKFKTSPAEQLRTAIIKQLRWLAKQQKWCEIEDTTVTQPSIRIVSNPQHKVESNTTISAGGYLPNVDVTHSTTKNGAKFTSLRTTPLPEDEDEDDILEEDSDYDIP